MVLGQRLVLLMGVQLVCCIPHLQFHLMYIVLPASGDCMILGQAKGLR